MPTPYPQQQQPPDKSELAARAQALAEEAGTNEDDERRAQQTFDETGEPVRDRLGNQSGAS